MENIQEISHYSSPEIFFKAIKTSLELAPALNIKVRGWSMAPVIKNGDIAVLEKINTGDIRRGNIIFFRTGSKRFVAHRVIDKKLSGDEVVFTAKGDVSLFFEREVHSADILGIIRRVVREQKVLQLDKVLCYKFIEVCNVNFAYLVIGLTYFIFKIKKILRKFLA